MSRFVLDRARWQRIKKREGIASDAEAARLLNVDQSTVSRAVSSGRVGGRLAAALLATWPDDFSDLVKVGRSAA